MIFEPKFFIFKGASCPVFTGIPVFLRGFSSVGFPDS
jgi:hypothetical protein